MRTKQEYQEAFDNVQWGIEESDGLSQRRYAEVNASLKILQELIDNYKENK